MEEINIEKFYKDLAMRNYRYLDIEFIRSHRFDEVVYDLFREAAMRNTVAAVYYQIIKDITDTIKHTPDIFNTYSNQDKQNFMTFNNDLLSVINETNKTMLSIAKISKMFVEIRQ